MIKKFQQGGQQDAMVQFVQGLAEVLQVDPQQVVQVAQQNPNALKAAVQVFEKTQDIQQAAQAFVQQTKQQAQRAAHGAKLQYLKSLKNRCAEDEEVVYYKSGGSLKCGCAKKHQDGGEVSETAKKAQKTANKVNDAVNKFKNRNNQLYKYKNTSQQERNQSDTEEYNDEFKNKKGKPERFNKGIGKNEKGSKIKKDCGGSAVAKFKMKCGSKMKKHQNGGLLNFFN